MTNKRELICEKIALAILLTFGGISPVLASQDKSVPPQWVKLFLQVEDAYLNRNVLFLESVLDDKYFLTSIVHIIGEFRTSRVQVKSELLEALKKSKKLKADEWRSLPDRVVFSKRNESEFCGVSKAEAVKKIRSIEYSHVEERKICFRHTGASSPLVIRQENSFSYSKIDSK
mgnify:CR=1 FL=1